MNLLCHLRGSVKIDPKLQPMLEKLPYAFLEKLVAAKMKKSGVKKYKDAAAALIAHSRSGKKDDFVWNEDRENKNKKVTIDISEDEIADITRQTEEFLTKKFPQVLQSVTDDSAVRVVNGLKAKWPEQAAWQDAMVAQFRHNLESRWGKGLDLLRMLLTIFREQGGENLKRLRRRKSVPAVQDVMFRLHARSCQVADEIITLLENGLADGAMARWRTLHELSVTAILIADNGEDIARRYVEHQFVEAKKAMDEYEKVMVPLGYKPMSKAERSRITHGYNTALRKYRSPFKSQYGWAAEHLKHPQPTFRDLEKAAKRADLRSYYQMASYNVHASAKGVFFRLGALNNAVLAGRSNAGLTEAAQNAAYTLCLIHSLLREIKQFSVAQIIAMKAIVVIRNEIGPAFLRAEKKLLRDDRAFRRVESLSIKK